jgi:cytochrome c biogenesis protein CcdA
MEVLQSWFDTVQAPFLSAFILGLMTAISPCPLATNITAIAYISKNINNKKLIFLNGIIYTLGRAFSYTVIGMLLYFGASKFQIAKFLSSYGEMFLGPLLVIIGFILLNVIKLNFLGKINIQEWVTAKLQKKGLLGTFLIGVVFALAFCPYSGALYFGMLIPLTITSTNGLYLPIIFALGTGLPVIIFAYLLAFAIGTIGNFHNSITKAEKTMRYLSGGVFIIVGFYYISIFYSN